MDKELSVAEAKELLLKAGEEELPELAKRLGQAEKAGVRKLAEQAEKRMAALQAERERMNALWKYEREHADCRFICGVDEAGRGPWVGPVVAGAVIFPKDCDILYINDSKKLSEKKREELYDVILEKAVSWGVGIVSPQRIDEINILQATYEAMREAIRSLDPQPDLLLNDAVKIPGISIAQIPIVKGDAKSASIGAASILAKVTRDRIMREYDSQYPEFHFAKNKGYGTAVHIEALRRLGPTPIHRRSFIKDYI